MVFFYSSRLFQRLIKINQKQYLSDESLLKKKNTRKYQAAAAAVISLTVTSCSPGFKIKPFFLLKTRINCSVAAQQEKKINSLMISDVEKKIKTLLSDVKSCLDLVVYSCNDRQIDR